MHRAGTRIAQTIATLALLAAHHPVTANAKAKLTTLYAFTGLADGGTPLSGLTYANGAIYGTTVIGGVIGTPECNRGCGTVFKVDPKTGGETVVYGFNGTPDGSGPSAGLILQGGKLYGTTISGGQPGCGYDGQVPCGTVFRVDPATGAENVLYSFSATGGDGEFPIASVAYHGGTIFGTTSAGGSASLGTVFALNPATGSETVLHSFTGGSDGDFPAAGVIYHSGTLYGTTEGGLEGGEGTVFAVDAISGTETVLVDFNSANGASPADGLLYNHGALYGTTTSGGQRSCCGVVFKVDPKTGAESVLYNFGSQNGDDGWDSTADVINVGGMLYGTTFAGGIANCFNGYTCGTIFQVDPKTGAEKVLYQFTGKSDQGQPLAGLIYMNGAFYGTTAGENVNACENHLGCGTVFKFVP